MTRVLRWASGKHFHKTSMYFKSNDLNWKKISRCSDVVLFTFLWNCSVCKIFPGTLTCSLMEISPSTRFHFWHCSEPSSCGVRKKHMVHAFVPSIVAPSRGCPAEWSLLTAQPLKYAQFILKKIYLPTARCSHFLKFSVAAAAASLQNWAYIRGWAVSSDHISYISIIMGSNDAHASASFISIMNSFKKKYCVNLWTRTNKQKCAKNRPWKTVIRVVSKRVCELQPKMVTSQGWALSP